MLVEQITEFELRGPGPPGRTCILFLLLIHIYPPLMRKRRRHFYFGRILTRLGVDHFPSFLVDV